jgi:hypothetical protein
MELIATTVKELQDNWRNSYMQWYAGGMPSFVTGDLSPWKQIKVKFNTMEDRQAFAELINFSLTEKTAVIWYPDKGREKNIMNRVVENV